MLIKIPYPRNGYGIFARLLIVNSMCCTVFYSHSIVAGGFEEMS